SQWTTRWRRLRHQRPARIDRTSIIDAIVPDLRTISHKRRIGGWRPRENVEFPHQSTVPKDPLLLSKLNLDSQTSILYIAGYTGEWAHGLVDAGAKVIYSDVD